MAMISKSALVEKLTNEFDLSKTKSKQITEFLINEIKNQVGSGNKVVLKGFGTFEKRKVNAKSYQSKFGKVNIKEHYKLGFKSKVKY